MKTEEITAQNMKELSETSKLDNILEAIERAASQSRTHLFLWSFGLFGHKYRTFSYGEKELDALRAKGFTITETEKRYRGIPFIEKPYTRKYHEIYW